VGSFLLRILEDARGRNVGDVVPVELHERKLEDEAHKVVEVSRVENLWVEHLIEAALRHTVIARVEIEGWTAVLDDVAVDVDTGFEVVQFVFSAVELEDLGGDALVCREEVQVDAVTA